MGALVDLSARTKRSGLLYVPTVAIGRPALLLLAEFLR
jgi:hypothetical protein